MFCKETYRVFSGSISLHYLIHASKLMKFGSMLQEYKQGTYYIYDVLSYWPFLHVKPLFVVFYYSIPFIIVVRISIMELKTPPQCDCGNEFMLLRTTGEYSTRPGHQYYIFPAGLKHRKRFLWYDEYKPSYTTDSSTTNIEEHSCHSSNTMCYKNHTMNASSSPYACPSNQPQSFARNNNDAMDRGMSSTTYTLPSQCMKSTPYAREQVCCCFGFLCALICFFFF